MAEIVVGDHIVAHPQRGVLQVHVGLKRAHTVLRPVGVERRQERRLLAVERGIGGRRRAATRPGTYTGLIGPVSGSGVIDTRDAHDVGAVVQHGGNVQRILPDGIDDIVRIGCDPGQILTDDVVAQAGGRGVPPRVGIAGGQVSRNLSGAYLGILHAQSGHSQRRPPVVGTVRVDLREEPVDHAVGTPRLPVLKLDLVNDRRVGRERYCGRRNNKRQPQTEIRRIPEDAFHRYTTSVNFLPIRRKAGKRAISLPYS